MSAGLYLLPADAEDQQHPHAADEMYVVLRGRGTLRVGDHNQKVSAGSVVSVDHGEDHRFVDIAEDLSLLVVFAPPEGSRGLARTAPVEREPQEWAGSTSGAKARPPAHPSPDPPPPA